MCLWQLKFKVKTNWSIMLVKQSEFNNGLNVSDHMYMILILVMPVLNILNGTDKQSFRLWPWSKL